MTLIGYDHEVVNEYASQQVHLDKLQDLASRLHGCGHEALELAWELAALGYDIATSSACEGAGRILNDAGNPFTVLEDSSAAG